MIITGSEKRQSLVQGEFLVSKDPNVILTTLLGSCVAACIFDPINKVGGMNHFLLPGEPNANDNGKSERFGAFLMEQLINAVMQQGGNRSNFKVKLFGGGAVANSAFSTAGQKNVVFAREFIRDEGMELVSESLGGSGGRKIEFTPTTGAARQKFLKVEEEKIVAPPPPKVPESTGDVCFF